MHQETLPAKLRNQLSPIFNLIELVLLESDNEQIKDLILSEAKTIQQNRKNILDLIEKIEEKM